MFIEDIQRYINSEVEKAKESDFVVESITSALRELRIQLVRYLKVNISHPNFKEVVECEYLTEKIIREGVLKNIDELDCLLKRINKLEEGV